MVPFRLFLRLARYDLRNWISSWLSCGGSGSNFVYGM